MNDTTASSTAAITVNGDSREVPADYELTALLRDIGVEPETATGIAVAINEHVVSQSDWASVTLSGGDTVEVITALQGG